MRLFLFAQRENHWFGGIVLRFEECGLYFSILCHQAGVVGSQLRFLGWWIEKFKHNAEQANLAKRGRAIGYAVTVFPQVPVENGDNFRVFVPPAATSDRGRAFSAGLSAGCRSCFWAWAWPWPRGGPNRTILYFQSGINVSG